SQMFYRSCSLEAVRRVSKAHLSESQSSRARALLALRRWTALAISLALLVASGEALFLHRHGREHGRNSLGDEHQHAEGFHAHVPRASRGVDHGARVEAPLPDRDGDDAVYLSWFHADAAPSSPQMPCLMDERRVAAPSPALWSRSAAPRQRIHDPP